MARSRRPQPRNGDEAWNEVARRGVSAEAIRMAREMGLNPRTLLVNIASVRSEAWKAPTDEWIRDLYEKRSRRSPRVTVVRDRVEG
jgi:hypothetical protein